MQDNQHSSMMKKILLKTAADPGISTQTDERIHTFISGYTPDKVKKRNPITQFRYNPVLGLVMILPLVVVLALSTGVGFLTVKNPTLPSLAFAGGSAHFVEDREKVLTKGTVLKEDNTLLVADNDICDLTLGDRASFRFFPSSHFTISQFRKTLRQIIVGLNKGSLYIDKKTELAWGRELQVQVDNYLFVLAGTRVFFSVSEKQIQVFCFEGMVKVILLSPHGSREIFSLYKGETIGIKVDDENHSYAIRSMTEEEMALDELLRQFLPFRMDFLSRLMSLMPREDKIDKKDIVYEKTPLPKPSLGARETEKEPEGEKEPFSITRAGRIDDPGLSGDGIHFLSTLSFENRGIVVTKNKVFYQEERDIKELIVNANNPLFSMKPLATGEYFLLISSQNIFYIHKETLAVEKTLSVSSREALLYNYHPVPDGSLLYIPVINTGYYTCDLSAGQPELMEFYNEKFPISPVVTDNGIILGSYNNNYIALLDKKGNTLWNFPLAGESWTNVLFTGKRLYAQSTRDGVYSLISLDMEGKKTGEWQIGNKCIADIWSYEHTLFGIYNTGTLFSLDIETGIVSERGTIITHQLSSELWRSISPYIDGPLFYIGTSGGELLCYNMAQNRQEYRITIDKSESFYASPYKIGNVLYLVSNKGNVFEVIKNE
jgi:hypothetical protein